MRYATIQSFLFLAVNLEKPVFLHSQKLKFPVKNLMKCCKLGRISQKDPFEFESPKNGVTVKDKFFKMENDCTSDLKKGSVPK